MSIYQPNAVLGNSHTLLTFGGAGEIMGLFYPHIDYPQNLQEGMPAVYFGQPGRGQFVWTFEDSWRKQQAYVPRRNILMTTLTHISGLEMEITDLVHPRRNIIARRFRLRNTSQDTLDGVLMQYLYLRLGEMSRKNSARRVDDPPAIVQYWRNVCFAMGGDTPDATQVGKAGGLSHNSAKNDMQDGLLSNQREELGDVDTAYAWNFWLRPGEEFERVFYISAAASEPAALNQLKEHAPRGFDEIYAMTDAWWGEWLSAVKSVSLDGLLGEVYYRSVLASRLLYDESYGSFLAAPEFDPLLERCGGYGFVWPRDAAEVVLALEQVGLNGMVEHFFEWAGEAQKVDGSWEQRYWINGERGPGWCTFDDSTQIDQTATMIYALGAYADRLPEAARAELQQRYWSMMAITANYLLDKLGENGLHSQAIDLWEKYRGSFCYSNASIHAALLAAARWAADRGQPALETQWREAAERIKSVLLADFWNGSYFARGLNDAGEIDWTIDTAMLGLFEPFEMLSLDVPEERQMVESMARVIRERLTKHYPDGEAIIRHEGDDYVGGSAGGVNTLWLARVLLRMAVSCRQDDPAKAQEYRAQAEGYMRVVIGHGTTVFLLPELIGSDTTPRWAAPHGWAMAAYIQCALLLDALEGASRPVGTREQVAAGVK
ncbi:MAG: glycoside hydrolase family 15 protein [Armatimonadota bacterium]